MSDNYFLLPLFWYLKMLLLFRPSCLINYFFIYFLLCTCQAVFPSFSFAWDPEIILLFCFSLSCSVLFTLYPFMCMLFPSFLCPGVWKWSNILLCSSLIISCSSVYDIYCAFFLSSYVYVKLLFPFPCRSISSGFINCCSSVDLLYCSFFISFDVLVRAVISFLCPCISFLSSALVLLSVVLVLISFTSHSFT